MKRRTTLVSAAVGIAVVAGAVPAIAFWTVDSSNGSGTVGVSTLGVPTVTQPAVATGTSKVTISVTAAPTAGPTPTGYRVARTSPTPEVSSVCTITGSTGSCDDNSPALGTDSYSIFAQLNGTVGGSSYAWEATTPATTTANLSSDTTPPVMSSMAVLDSNGNGKLDGISITFNEAMGSSSTNSGVTVTGLPTGGVVTGAPSVSGSVVTLAVDETSEAVTTAVGSVKVAVAASSGLKDLAGNAATAFAATSPSDGAAPALTALQMFDTQPDGKIDRVTAAFSEPIATSTATAQWSLTNVPSYAAGTSAPASVSTTGSTATLTITPGTGAADTAVGTFTVALGASGTGIRDAAGNQSSFASTAPTDKAGPVPVSITDTNGSTDGKVETNDTLAVTFSEPVLSSSVPATTTLAFSRSANGANTIAAGGFISGSPSTGLSGNNYVNGTGTATFSFNASLAVSGVTVTLTVGTNLTGSGNVGTAGSAGSFSYVPDPVVTDASGNAAGGSRSQSLKLF